MKAGLKSAVRKTDSPTHRLTLLGGVSIVISSLGEHEAIIGDAVNQAMLAGDSSGPDARPEVAKRLGLSESLERVPPDVFDESEDFQSDFAIGGDPVLEVFQKIAVEDQQTLIRHDRNESLQSVRRL